MSSVPVLVLAVLGAACGSARFSDQDRARLDAALAAVEAKVGALMAARTEGLRAAIARPPGTSGPCTRPLPPANALVRAPDGPPPTGEGASQAARHFTLIPRWALDDAPPSPSRGEREALWGSLGRRGTNHGQYELSRDYVKTTVARGTLAPGETIEQRLAQIERLGSSASWDWELVIVTERFTAPRELGNARFAAGEIEGRALLWSYPDAAVVCAGPVAARNQDAVMSIKVDARFANGKNGFLDRDLEAQAFAAAVTGLQAVAAPASKR